MGTTYLKSNLLQKLTTVREEVLYEVFLDLRKAYDTLEWERCMEILVGYRVGPRTEIILRYYWDHLSMVNRVGRYYATPLKGHRGVTQGDTISPTIFNMEVDAVIYHWITLVVGEEAGPDGFRRAIQWMTALFYANNMKGLTHHPNCFFDVRIEAHPIK